MIDYNIASNGLFGVSFDALTSEQQEAIIDINNQILEITELTNLKQKLINYYEVDLDNCEMSHEMWIDELVKCMLTDGYKESFLEQYDEYQKLRCE